MNVKLIVTLNERGVTRIVMEPSHQLQIHYEGSGDRRPFERWMECYLQRGTSELPPLDLSQFTSLYCQKVCLALHDIPFGERLTYGQLAKNLGTAPRPLGGALSKNPFPLLLPCHRVVACGGIGGFAFGLTVKRELLRVESEN